LEAGIKDTASAKHSALSIQQSAKAKPNRATKANRKSKTQTRKPSRALRVTTPAREHRAVRHPSLPTSGKPGALVRGPRAKARRRGRRSDDSGRVATFPEVKGKVVREVRFSHHGLDNVLAIAFKDRTVLVFDIDPEPLVLPVEIRPHYISDQRSAARAWERLATDK
jgi:hypothetical protein